MTLLSVEDLSVKRGRRRVVERVSFAIEPHEFVGLIGPNGAGKTTLMRAALGLMRGTGRSSISALDPRARARAAAWLPQSRDIAWPIDVSSVVALGRLPHLPRGAGLSDVDKTAVDQALDAMGLRDFENRVATDLSGGEQARVLIARTLAQDAPLLLADEPIAGLDPAHQLSTMQVFRSLAEEGRGVVTALHDLPLAARYCTRLLLLEGGALVADGPPREVLTPENVARVFRVQGRFLDTGDGTQFQVLEPI